MNLANVSGRATLVLGDEITDVAGEVQLHVVVGEDDRPALLLIPGQSDLQAERVRQLVTGAGQPLCFRSFPTMGHSMHGQDAALFVATVAEWADAEPSGS